MTPAVLELPRVPQLPPVFSLENDPPGATSHFVQTTPLDVFKVRGANYLEDKVKMDASAAALDLLGADLVRTEAIAIEHACAGNAAVRMAQIRKDHPGRDILLINFQLPGRPGGISLMLWFGLTEVAKSDPSFYPLWQKWFSGDSDEFRNQRLKFIPHAHQASWMLKKAVGNRPVILGKAMKMRYHRGDSYLEIDIDIASIQTNLGSIPNRSQINPKSTQESTTNKICFEYVRENLQIHKYLIHMSMCFHYVCRLPIHQLWRRPSAASTTMGRPSAAPLLWKP